MAKKSSLEKNNKRQRMVKTQGATRAKVKAQAMDRSASMEDRFAAQMKLASLPRDSSRSRIRNRCNLTGRPRAFYRKLGLSRIALRNLASIGQIPGMTKSSW